LKLVSISESGLATGFYDVNNEDVPLDAFEISNALYDIWIANTDTMVWDKHLEDLVELKTEISIEERITVGLTKIDNLAERTRQQIMTIGYGQALVYLEKFDEATDYVVDGYPDNLTSYPFIRNESEAFMESPKVIADRILAKKSEWIGKASKIESARLIGKHNIRTAETVEGINLIVSIAANKIKDII